MPIRNIIPRKPTPNAAKKKSCTKRDVMLGFWIGLAMAAIYLNTKRKPVINVKNHGKTTTSRGSVDDTVNQAVGSSSTSSRITTEATNQNIIANANAATVTSTNVVTKTTTPVVSTLQAPKANGMHGYKPKPGHQDFKEIGSKERTDKVWGADTFEKCVQDDSTCPTRGYENPRCRTLQGHFYHTIYNRWLGKYSTDDTEPFQFLEIGFYNGHGFDAYKAFLPRAETHSIEIACLPKGDRSEGKWPFGNFAAENKNYQHYRDTNQLHCGDGADYDFLQQVWTTKMKRPDAPPLKVVVDDAAHVADHMAKSVFFWFPKIEPGGILVVEDIQPINEANKFRTHFLPQMMKDLHYCGDPKFPDKACFPTLWPLLHSIHCEMHICVFERNELPSVEYDKEQSIPPPHALDAEECLLKASGGATYG